MQVARTILCILFLGNWGNSFAVSYGVRNQAGAFIDVLQKEFHLHYFERRVKHKKSVLVFQEYTNSTKKIIVFFHKKANARTDTLLKSIYIYAQHKQTLLRIGQVFIEHVTPLLKEKKRQWTQYISLLQFQEHPQHYSERSFIPQLRCLTQKIKNKANKSQHLYYLELEIID